MDLPHSHRHKWVEEISKINKKINKQATQQGRAASPGGINLDFR